MIRANLDSPLTSPLRENLVVSAEPVALPTEEPGHTDGVESAFLYGSFVPRVLGVESAAPNDIDLMAIATPDVSEVFEICTRVEAAVHRPVNQAVLTAAELAKQSGFLDSVRAGSVVPLVGELSQR